MKIDYSRFRFMCVRTLFAAFFVVTAFGVVRAHAATLSLSPASGTFTVGGTITVNVLLDTQGAAIDGVDFLYLNFNPAQLQVIDEDAGSAGVQILPGSLMGYTAANTVDTVTGRVEFSQVTLSCGPLPADPCTPTAPYSNSSPQILATIRFNVVGAGTSPVTFDFTPGSTADTNVTQAGGTEVDLLNSVTNASFTLSSTFDYNLTNTGNITVTQGQAGVNTVNATLVGGTAQSVSLVASGLPVGATPTFSPLPASCTPTCAKTLTISTLASVAAGSYPVTITGTPLSKTTTFTLTVNPIPSTKFLLNDIVEVTIGPLNVRSTPNGTILGTQALGNRGTVINGVPVFANNLWWWQIDYDTGVDGWSIEDNLELAVNTAPSPIDAGANQSITLPASANLDGTVGDDGLPSGTLITTWSMDSGPGIVTFGNAALVDTTASFSTAGTYVLRLTADDTALQSSDTVQITVNPVPDTTPPTVTNTTTGSPFPAGTTQASISVQTSDASPPSTCRYSTVAGTAYAAMINTLTSGDGVNHSATVTSLSDGQTFTYYVRCQDSAASPNANTSDRVVAIDVDAPPPNFNMSVSNATPNVIRGQSVSINVDTTLSSGSPGAVTFSIPASEIPAGVTETFTPPSCTPPCQSVLQFDTTTAAPIGTHMLTVTGDSAAIQRLQAVDLVILPRLVTLLDFTTTLEGVSTNVDLATHTFTVEIIDASGPTTVSTWSATPNAVSGVLSQPVGNDFDEGTYDVRVDAPGYLSDLLLAQTIAPGDAITVSALLSGDLNDDNTINSVDWSLMNLVWFTADTTADINNDGIVNSIDFSFMNKNWGLFGT